MSDLDDDLPPAGLDLGGYFRLLAARLGRAPTLGEVSVFRHDVCAERLRRIRRRRAARKGARRPASALGSNRGRGEPDPATEFLSSMEWMMAVSLMLSLVICVTELAAIRVQGRRITVRTSTMAAAAKAVVIAADERDDPHELGPRPLGSFTPDATMLAFRAVHERRAAEATELFGHPHYGRAVAMLLRSNGAPISTVNGVDPWELVRGVDPAVADYLRTLGTDPSEWGTLRIQVTQARTKASEAARDNRDRGPAYVDRMMQLASPQEAAAYCAWKYWRPLGEAKADENELDGVDLEAAPAPKKETEPSHG